MTADDSPVARTKDEWNRYLLDASYPGVYRIFSTSWNFHLDLVDRVIVPSPEDQLAGTPVSFRGEVATPFSSTSGPMFVGLGQRHEWFRYGFYERSLSAWITPFFPESARGLLESALLPFLKPLHDVEVVVCLESGRDERGRAFDAGTNFFAKVDLGELPLFEDLLPMLGIHGLDVDVHLASGMSPDTLSYRLDATLNVDRGVWDDRLYIETVGLTFDQRSLPDAGSVEALVLVSTLDVGLPGAPKISMTASVALVEQTGTANAEPYWQFAAKPDGGSKTWHPLGLPGVTVTIDSVTVKTRGPEQIGIDGQGAVQLADTHGTAVVDDAAGRFYLDKAITGFTALSVKADEVDIGALSDVLTGEVFGLRRWLRIDLRELALDYANEKATNVEVTVDGGVTTRSFEQGWSLSGWLDLWGWHLDISEATYSGGDDPHMSVEASSSDTVDLGALEVRAPHLSIGASKATPAGWFSMECQLVLGTLLDVRPKLRASAQGLLSASALPGHDRAPGVKLVMEVTGNRFSSASLVFSLNEEVDLSVPKIAVLGVTIFEAKTLAGVAVNFTVEASVTPSSLTVTASGQASVSIGSTYQLDAEVTLHTASREELLRQVTPQLTAELKQQLEDIAKGLAAPIGEAAFGLAVRAASRAIAGLGYGTDHAMDVLSGLGIPATVVAGLLEEDFAQTAQQVAGLLRARAYEVRAVAAALKVVFSQGKKQVTDLLRDVGYSSHDIDQAVKDFDKLGEALGKGGSERARHPHGH